MLPKHPSATIRTMEAARGRNTSTYLAKDSYQNNTSQNTEVNSTYSGILTRMPLCTRQSKAIRVWSRVFRPTKDVIDQRPKKRGRRTLPPQPTDRITRASIRNEPVQQTTPVPINLPPVVRRAERSSSQPPPMSERQDVGPRLLLNRALGPENPAPPQSEEGRHRWQAESSLAQSSQARRQSLRKKQAPKHHQDYQKSTSKKYSKK